MGTKGGSGIVGRGGRGASSSSMRAFVGLTAMFVAGSSGLLACQLTPQPLQSTLVNASSCTACPPGLTTWHEGASTNGDCAVELSSDVSSFNQLDEVAFPGQECVPVASYCLLAGHSTHTQTYTLAHTHTTHTRTCIHCLQTHKYLQQLSNINTTFRYPSPSTGRG